MIIDVIKLKSSGKDYLDFSFEYVYNGEESLFYNTVIDGAINFTGSLQLHRDDVYVDGEISCTIVGECARCLEKAKETFVSDIHIVYVRDNPKDDEYSYKSGKIDMRQAVNDFLIINLPTIIYCKQDCKGLCPTCGCNLNNENCSCKN